MRGPALRRRVDDRRIDVVRAGHIEPPGDHDQLARNSPQRAVRVPEAVQVREEASSFLGEGSCTLAGAGDGTTSK
jgi:hypothetical protein